MTGPRRRIRPQAGAGETSAPLRHGPPEFVGAGRTAGGGAARPKPLVGRGFWLVIRGCPQRDSNPCYRLERAMS